MGRVQENQPQPTIHHFSHPHPLNLLYHHPQQSLSLASCLSCKLDVSGLVYSCQPCKYFLHISCSQMPQQIKHPFDPNHVLSLLPTPIYKEGYFKCDACGEQGKGFSYHCDVCSIDLHTNCSTMPLHVVSSRHHHRLDLTFSPPYQNKIFCCDVCKSSGCNQWLYRCRLCEFDAHLLCARENSVHAFQQTTHVQSTYGNQMNNCNRPTQAVGIPLTAAPPHPPPYNQPGTNYYAINSNYNAAVSGGGGFGSASTMRPVPMNGGRQRSDSLNSIFQGIQNINQNFNDQLIQGIIGLVGGGGSGGAAAVDGGGVGVDPGYNLDLTNAINVNDFSGIDLGGLAGGMDLSNF